MAAPKCITIDFETDEILDRPDYPPKPLGFSIKWPGQRKAKYWSFGHDTENNCDKADAERELKRAYASGTPLLFYNGKFDADVAEVHMGCPLPSWELMHDAMFMIFLYDPHARDMRLKPMAEKLLQMPPDERNEVQEWLIDNKIIGKAQKAQWFKHLRRVPGALCGKYADGDVIRTEALFKHLYQDIVDRGMLMAYDRERGVMPVLLQSEREGMRCDVDLLRADIKLYDAQMTKADAWLAKRLGVPGLNVDADKGMADALENAGVVTDWVMTKGGKNTPPQKSVAKDNLTSDMFHDQKVAQVYGYRNRLATCLRMFMYKWLEQAERTGGYIYTNWNQVRQPKGDKQKGARTGRISSNPNFQNLSKDWYDRNDHYEHPKVIKLIELPKVRRYILPDKGEVFCHRDYNQQELRILAHFEDGKLMEAYTADPRLDVHDFVKNLILEMAGLDLPRRTVKPINFGAIYGMGIGKFAIKMEKSIAETKVIMKAYSMAMPGVAELQKAIKAIVKDGLPIVTWGGREYYVEAPVLFQGRWLDFTYKLLNYLIQGSAADCTKESIIRYNSLKKDGRFLLTVHDEINITAPKKGYLAELLRLRDAMEGVVFDIQMLTDAKAGPNWADLAPVVEKR
jgi:DNA polymerase I-like protein with 3'-5' exonuclease and polymerase domains